MNLFVLAKYQYRKNIDKLKKTYRERSQILTEFVTSEAEYVKTLGFLTCECKVIMVQELNIEAEEFDGIFGCVESISMLHNEFYRELQGRFETRDQPTFHFGDILVKYVPYFKVYSTYMRTLSSRKNALVQIKAQGRLSNFKDALQRKSGSFTQKFGSKMIKYMTNIEVIDYINSPFQRIYKYDMFLTRYLKLLNNNNPDLLFIQQAMSLLKEILYQFNEDMGQSHLIKCIELEKRYGSIVMPQRRFQGEFAATYWTGGMRMPACRIYIMNDLLLIVDDNSGKMIRRMQMDSQSWYHKFHVGKNINNAIFIKGSGDSSQTVFLPMYTIDEFVKILRKLFLELPNRASLQNNSPSLIIKPVSVSRQENNCLFTLYIKIYGARGATYNTYTIAELQKVMAHLISKHQKRRLFRTLQQVSQMNLHSYSDSQMLSDFDAEHLALSLFPYLAPLMCDFQLIQSDDTFQYLFGIRDYVAVSMGQLLQDTNMPTLSKDILRLEQRVRVEQIQYDDRVEVNFVTESGYKRKLRIGKQQRAYSVIRRIICQDFNLDFAIFIDSSKSKMRILDDDEVVYSVMRREGYVFKEESNLLMTSLRKIDNYLGGKETTVYLRKYLYLQSAYPEMLEKVDQQRLQFMTDNILHIMYEQRERLSINKIADLLALVMKLKQYGMTATQQQQLVSDFWKFKVQDSNQPENSFRNLVFKEYAKLLRVNIIECFVRLFSSVEFWPQYSYNVDCSIGGTQAKLIIKHRVLQVRQSVDSEVPLLRVDLSELEYTTTPSSIRLKRDQQEIKIDVDWVYGVAHVIERNLHIQKIKSV